MPYLYLHFQYIWKICLCHCVWKIRIRNVKAIVWKRKVKLDQDMSLVIANDSVTVLLYSNKTLFHMQQWSALPNYIFTKSFGPLATSSTSECKIHTTCVKWRCSSPQTNSFNKEDNVPEAQNLKPKDDTFPSKVYYLEICGKSCMTSMVCKRLTKSAIAWKRWK